MVCSWKFTSQRSQRGHKRRDHKVNLHNSQLFRNKTMAKYLRISEQKRKQMEAAEPWPVSGDKLLDEFMISWICRRTGELCKNFPKQKATWHWRQEGFPWDSGCDKTIIVGLMTSARRFQYLKLLNAHRTQTHHKSLVWSPAVKPPQLGRHVLCT